MITLTEKILVWVATLATLIINFLAVSLPLNNISTAAISDSFDVYFVPAGYVFSIWGVIYILLIVFSIYASGKDREDQNLKSVIPWYLVAAIANCAWLFAWHYLKFGLSVIIMLVLLVSLIRIYTLLPRAASAIQKYMRNLPISVYLGWISVATIANITDYLEFIGWNGWGISELTWASIMIGVAGLLTVIMLWRNRDIAYALVILWAIYGIRLNFINENTISVSVLSVMAVIVVVALYRIIKKSPANAAL